MRTTTPLLRRELLAAKRADLARDRFSIILDDYC
jgi:hypothetical protein